MKSLTTGIIASLCFHVLLFALFLVAKFGQKVTDGELFVEFQTPAAVFVQTEKPRIPPEMSPPPSTALELPQTTTDMLAEKNLDEATPSNTPAFPNTVDSLAQNFPDDWQLNTLSFWTKKTALANPSKDSSLAFQQTRQSLVLKPLPKLPPSIPNQGGDRIDRDIYKRNTGQEKPMPLSNALSAGAQLLSNLLPQSNPQPVHMTFIPSKIEIEALNTIWKQSKATDQEIYASMDSSIKITAEDLNTALTALTNKGLVMRELISPRNEFTVQTPVGGVGIEMSAKNRRNRVYRYQSRISRNEMLRFLNAALYQLESGMPLQFSAPGDSLILIRQLEEKILSVSQNR